MFTKALGATWHVLDTGEQILINDLTKFAVFKDQYKDSPQMYLEYTIRDGDRAETISKKLYETGRFWWVVYLFNDMFNIDEQWPLTEDQLNRYIKLAYPDQDPIDTLHYTNIMGDVEDVAALRAIHGIATDDLVIARFALTPVSIQTFETKRNDAKRNVKLVDPDFIGAVEADLIKAFSRGG